MKLMIYLGAGIGGIIGGYIPALLWHDGMLSGWSLLFGFVGTILGCWAGYKIGQIVE